MAEITNMSEYSKKFGDIVGDFISKDTTDIKDLLDLQPREVRNFIVGLVNILNSIDGANSLSAKGYDNLKTTIQAMLNDLNTRKVDITGDFKGTLNGMPIVAADPGLSSTVASHTEQLSNNTKKTEGTKSIKDFGAVGDGISDDSQSFEDAFTYALTNKIRLYLPPGIYKVTRPITMTYDTTHKYLLSSIEGAGDYAMPASGEPNTVIKGYNIPANRAVLELHGIQNGYAARQTLKNLAITQDSSCDDKSFCLSVGDSWLFLAEKVALRGKNGLNLRCGAGETGTYSQIGFQMRQCNIWATNTTNNAWAVFSEIYRTGIGSPSDNIRFESCYFLGLVSPYVYMCKFDTCMFQINPQNSKAAFVAPDGVLDGITVNYSANLMITSGLNVEIDNCYFEDLDVGIDVIPIKSAHIRNIMISNCYINGRTNYTNPDTSPIYASRAIQFRNNSSWKVINATILNCTFRDNTATEATCFSDTIIYSDNCVENLQIINPVISLYFDKKLRTNINAIKFLLHDYFYKTAMRVEKTDFTINSWTGTTVTNKGLYGGIVEGFPITKQKCFPQKVVMIANKNLLSDFLVSIRKNGSAYFSLTKASADTTYTDASGNIIYVWEKASGLQGYSFIEGDIFVAGLGASTADVSDAGALVKIIVDLGY